MALAKSSPRTPQIPQDLELPSSSDYWRNGKPIKSKLCTDFDDNSEYADLAEKVLQNLNGVFERDNLIDEFDIVPVESKANHSPVIHDAAEHKLALESWCIPYLYTHSYKSFFAIRRKQKCSSSTNGTTSPSSAKYGSVEVSKLSESDRICRGLLLSRLLSLLNPDLAAAWNFRREYLQIASVPLLENELRLVSLVATRKPKCPEGFSYRRWLVEQALLNNLIDLEVISGWTLNETASIEVPINRYFSNYHSWSYRLWLIQKILNHKSVPSEQKHLVLDNELHFSDKWMNTQVSDYCGHHYRQKLLQLIIETHFGTDPPISRLRKELEENGNRIVMYEGHETLWFHRRAVVKMLERATEDESKLGFSSTFTTSDLEDIEKKFLTLIQDSLSVKACHGLNSTFFKKYVVWLNAQFKHFNLQHPLQEL